MKHYDLVYTYCNLVHKNSDEFFVNSLFDLDYDHLEDYWSLTYKNKTYKFKFVDTLREYRNGLNDEFYISYIASCICKLVDDELALLIQKYIIQNI
jgi:hypothetical protein